ncbi:MAG: ubiquinol-cytochrome c reductase iron-sulfur subunit [Verrucomicrobia bacterium]|nr:ubiquinol-cytochrome c reductase iron-sulfur subunit [Verrucomicrobiota bacterium]
MDYDTNDHTPPPGTRVGTPSRRDFLFKLGAGLNAIAAVMVGVPIIGFVASSFIKKPAKWISLGPLTQFPENTTRMAVFLNPYRRPEDGDTAHIPVWVRHLSKDEFKVFAVNCTHLGCPVRWFEESELFLCPCHGGAFYADGAHAAGPPPRGLYQYEHKVENNELHVRGGYLPTLQNPV